MTDFRVDIKLRAEAEFSTVPAPSPKREPAPAMSRAGNTASTYRPRRQNRGKIDAIQFLRPPTVPSRRAIERPPSDAGGIAGNGFEDF